jgi:hypothetical protein
MKINLSNPFNWVAFLAILSAIFGILFRIFDIHWMYVAAIVPWAPIALFISISILFAWVINPIRALVKWIKKKKSEK